MHYVSVMRNVVPQGGGILVSSASNVAVDNLVSGLLGLGVRVVRIGHPAKVAEGLRHVTLDALVLDHPIGTPGSVLVLRNISNIYQTYVLLDTLIL